MNHKISEVNKFIQAERDALLSHPLYKKIKTIDDLKVFTQGHVYAVWDFMSLLKALQIKLTCTSIPWFATEKPNTRYLINEIVLAEESDEYLDGSRLSHFEMYLDAMNRLGANNLEMLEFIQLLKSGLTIHEVLQTSSLDPRIVDFLQFTFDTIEKGELHQIASAFTFGREDLIPDLFNAILVALKAEFPGSSLDYLIYYFQRHIDLDGDEHGPLAMQMIEELAEEDENKWYEVKLTAQEALKKRLALWDAIYDQLLK